MSKDLTYKGRLPACIITNELMEKLWDIMGSDGDVNWQAAVGTGGDLLGKQQDRPRQVITDWQELVARLEILPRIDQLDITTTVTGKGTITITFKNYAPAGGILVVNGQTKEWAEKQFAGIKVLFDSYKDNYATMLNSKIGFGLVHTVIPLISSFILVMVLAGLLIPVSIRRSQWVWWITAGTIVVTLRLAYTISDKLIIYVLKKYPYIQSGVPGKK